MMTLQEAATVLRQHNAWRRGGDGEMIEPRYLGLAIDLACDHIEHPLGYAAPAPSAVKESLTTGAHTAVPDDDEPEAIATCLEDDAEILRDVDGYEAIPANMEKAAALIRRLAAQQQKEGE